ncbi:hypothetical protein H310_05688 [Aphanomyces invadans]|uniref:Secreted protein n=1 Tax=Aphanomyces invadans TaxID=157072 RepID=A0A024U6M6_9STRA|nr:hypothetical protein H310_05688 [Aphanomyces invadans]ETW02081.1 hypothetical protein H310_05688 [Aphanomyces invadans]|eukprot:XP_008868686.1 hypothetical protein H310_05688 [Aphanomyces invadans]
MTDVNAAGTAVLSMGLVGAAWLLASDGGNVTAPLFPSSSMATSSMEEVCNGEGDATGRVTGVAHDSSCIMRLEDVASFGIGLLGLVGATGELSGIGVRSAESDSREESPTLGIAAAVTACTGSCNVDGTIAAVVVVRDKSWTLTGSANGVDNAR